MPPRQNSYPHDGAERDEEPPELDLAEFSRAALAESSPLSGQRAMFVDAEVIARLDDLFEAESGHPFDETEGN